MTNIYEIFDDLKNIRRKFEKILCDKLECNECPYDCADNDLLSVEDKIENAIIDLSAMTEKKNG